MTGPGSVRPNSRQFATFGRYGRLGSTLFTILLLGTCSLPREATEPIHYNVPVSEVHSLSSGDDLVDIIDLRVSSSVWVLGTVAPFVTQVSLARGQVRAFGSEGAGPGELQQPLSLAIRQDSVAVLDAAKRALIWYDTTGTYLGQTQLATLSLTVARNLARTSYGRPGLVRTSEDNLYLSAGLRPEQQTVDLNYQVILRWHGAGLGDTLLRLPRDSAAARDVLGNARELVPVNLWTTCGDSLLLFDPFAETISWFNTASVVHSDTISAPRRILGDSVIRRNLRFQLGNLLGAHLPPPDQFSAMIESMLEQSKASGRHPKEEPGWVALECDGAGRAWLERFSLDDSPIGYGRTWDVLDIRGRRSDVTFPNAFRPLAFKDGMAVGYVADSLGVPSVAFIHLPEGLR